MGRDLKLLPLDLYNPVNESTFYSSCVLDLQRSHSLWRGIDKLPMHPLSTFLYTPLGEDDHIINAGVWSLRRISEDGNGSPLCWVSAADLLTLRNHERVQDNFANRAAWAYISELPNETSIVLFWS